MTQAAVQNAEQHVSSPEVDKGVLLAAVVAAIVIVKLARCIAPSAPTAAMRHRYLFSREKTDPSIAMIATNRNVPIAQTTDDHAGNLYERGRAALPSKP